MVTNDFTRSCRSNGLTAKKALSHARALRRMVRILHNFCGPAEYVIILNTLEVMARPDEYIKNCRNFLFVSLIPILA